MPDREKVIEWADICLSSAYSEKCNECPYQINHEGLYSCVEGILRDTISLLKEQDETLHKKQHDVDRLCNEISEWKHKFHDKLLKEQEAVEPTWQQGKAYCGSCGKRIPLKIGARYCHKCGVPVLWEGR